MTATAAAAAPGSSAVVRDVLERAADPEQWERFERQLRATGYCRRPIRLRGRVDAVDLATGELRTVYSTDREPDETLLTCCGNRREAVCPSCAETYRGDAFQLVAAGMRGGKGVPESVVEHPMLFVTLTAPSFGLVHSRRTDSAGQRAALPAAAQGRGLPRTACGSPAARCTTRTILGSASRCARAALTTTHAVLWNAMAPTLWRYTSNAIPRELARLVGTSERRLRRRVRVSYVKVAEYQRRGALHFHVLVRLDRAQPPGRGREGRAAAGRVHGASCSSEAVRAAVERTSVLSPTPDAERSATRPRRATIRWGPQTEIRPLELDGASAAEAARTAGYIAKYATKSTEVVGGLMHPLDAADLPRLKVRPHARRLVECAWRLGGEPHLEQLRLRRWAHALGFRGHCFTKSRRYSTTFTRLRQARHEHQLRRQHGGEPRDPWGRPVSEGASVERRRWSLAGIGYRTLGDAWLAESGAKRRREERRVAREELGAGPPGPVARSEVRSDRRLP